jgi:tRNA pseudouridine38-40 synthase
MRNIKLTLEYDGTNYHGWQSQIGSGKPTIQDTLEKALFSLAKEEIKTYSSGRTDAGVHALGHVANFTTISTIPAAAWAPALNHLLPHDIRILLSQEVALDFNARFSALGKSYKYRILNRHAPTALERYYAWHVNMPLNVTNMSAALEHVIGKHDFSAFRGSGCNAKSPVRHITRASINTMGDIIEIWLEADAFLQYMVRNITGTLVEVGLGRFSSDEVKSMLQSRDRTKAGRTAPSQGLYLVRVSYPAE